MTFALKQRNTTLSDYLRLKFDESIGIKLQIFYFVLPIGLMIRIVLCICLLMLASCHKMTDENVAPPIQEQFREYFIKAGDHFSDHEAIVPFQGNILDFKVKFDSSAIYTTQLPSNQADINKLYGFSDNRQLHHEFSARFGWRYFNNKLTLHAYIYNNGIRESKEVAVVQPGKEYHCVIVADKEKYYFVVNGITTIMMRKSTIPKPEGYKLFPYFGGDEPAPHDIRIYIKEL